ncbi:MAG: hypothetical protein LC774_02780, partial [Acidobacteria bacterium]|nr:hypothetical protein [Acidobacteriota bacterium]
MSLTADQKPSRLFYAVEPSAEARDRASAHVASLRGDVARRLKVSWERAEKLHVTMKFVGDVAGERVARLSRAARRVAARHAP